MELKNRHAPSHQGPFALYFVRNNYGVVFVLEIYYAAMSATFILTGLALTWGQTILYDRVRRHRLVW